EASAGGPIAGATFAIEGFRPPDPPAPRRDSIDDALAAIARDKDVRFAAPKKIAVNELGRRGTPAATAALVAIITDPATLPELADDAGSALLAHPSSVAPLLAALSVRRDHVTGARPRGVALFARALGAARAREAVAPLLDQLEDPATPPAAADEIASALVQI